jgi:TM2 domain-containing membrane protein YozV
MSTYPVAGPRCQNCSATLAQPYAQCQVCGSVQASYAEDPRRAGYAPSPPAAYPSYGESAQSPHQAYSGGWAPSAPHAQYPVQSPAPYHAQPQMITVVTAKSSGIAVLLTFLWLGAGHLYAGRITTGIVLIVTDFILWALSFTVILAIITVPLFVILLIISAVLAAQAAKDFNYRNGLVLR